MPKLKLTSDDPDRSFELSWNDGPYEISRNGNASWDLRQWGSVVRLGAKSLHWTTALRRAIEHIEGE